VLGQTVNVDLCFVPANHVTELKLPAVSGSSGRLVVERPFSVQRQALRHEASQPREQRLQTRAQRKQEDAKVPYGSPSGSWRSLRFRKLAGYTLVLATRRSGVALA
jgi:hypothetical protein